MRLSSSISFLGCGEISAELTFQMNPDEFLCEGTPVVDAQGLPMFEPTELTTASGEAVDLPICELTEGWDSNNTSSLSVATPAEGSFVNAACTRAQIDPMHDCGFTEQNDTFTCDPGDQVTLECTAAGAAAPQVARVCENSARLGTGLGCIMRDSLGNQVVDGTRTTITFTCPEARDPGEPGGAWSLVVAPVVPGDARLHSALSHSQSSWSFYTAA